MGPLLSTQRRNVLFLAATQPHMARLHIPQGLFSLHFPLRLVPLKLDHLTTRKPETTHSRTCTQNCGDADPRCFEVFLPRQMCKLIGVQRETKLPKRSTNEGCCQHLLSSPHAARGARMRVGSTHRQHISTLEICTCVYVL